MSANTPISKTQACWYNMLARCTNPSNPQYKDYGARGITVASEWHHYPTFLADMGEMPEGLTLERKDNNQGYNKSNCEWATRAVQASNRRPRSFDSRNTSGVVGVVRDSRNKSLWLATYKGKKLGTFSEFEHAVAARRRAENGS